MQELKKRKVLMLALLSMPAEQGLVAAMPTAPRSPVSFHLQPGDKLAPFQGKKSW